MTLKVTVLDVETGQTGEATVVDGDYVLICAAPCRLADTQAYPTNGMHVLTIKGHSPKRAPVVSDNSEVPDAG